MDIRRVFQATTLTVSVISLIVLIYRAYIAKRCTRLIMVAPILLMAHMVIFNGVLLLSMDSIDLDHILLGYDLSFHTWSDGVRLHSIITVIGLTHAYIKTHRMKEELDQWTTQHKLFP